MEQTAKSAEKVDSRQDRPSFTIYKDPEPTLSEREGTAELNILSETETEVGRPSSGGASAGPSEGSDAAPRSWFNRLTGVYNVAERHIAKGARALQKLAAPLSHEAEIQEAKAHLETLARNLRGIERQKHVRQWLELLEKPSLSHLAHRPVIVTEPASPATSSEGDEEDWQQLSALPASGRAQQQSTNSDVHSGPGFRGLFLRSSAFAYLIEGYAMAPPIDDAEHELLVQLIFSCCGRQPAVEELLKTLNNLFSTHRECNLEEVDDRAVQSIAGTAAQAVSSLQSSAAVEEADGKLEILKEEIAEQAATAALLHKFNYGNQSPGREVTQKKLAQGLVATNEVMLLGEALCRLAETKLGLLPLADVISHDAFVDEMQQRSAALASTSSLADIELTENLRQQQDSRAFKERKLADMKENVDIVQAEIKTLQVSRVELLAQLEIVELSMAKAQAKQADLEEGRNVFEEGSNFTLQALEQQAAQLCKLQRQCLSETKALSACTELVQQAVRSQSLISMAARDGAVETALQIAREYSHAATRHLYFQRANLQLLLRKLTFCGTELAESEERHKRATKLGMSPLLADVLQQKHHLMLQYLEAEGAFTAHLAEVGNVHERTQQMNDRAKALLPPHRSIEQSSEMQEILNSIGTLKDSFESMDRPSDLPKQGERLPELQAVLSHAMRARGSGASKSSSSPEPWPGQLESNVAPQGDMLQTEPKLPDQNELLIADNSKQEVEEHHAGLTQNERPLSLRSADLLIPSDNTSGTSDDSSSEELSRQA